MAGLLQVVRRIEVVVREVKWAEAGELVAIISEASFYVLRFDRDAVEAAQGQALPEDGLEEAFDLLHEVPETVRTGGPLLRCSVTLQYCMPVKPAQICCHLCTAERSSEARCCCSCIMSSIKPGHACQAIQLLMQSSTQDRATRAASSSRAFLLRTRSWRNPCAALDPPAQGVVRCMHGQLTKAGMIVQACGLERPLCTTTAPGGSTTAWEGR